MYKKDRNYIANIADMTTLSLIFDRNNAYLGEVVTQSGSLNNIILNNEGESKVGAYFSEWSTRGVPVMREVMHTEATGREYVFFQERVQMRQSEFLNALRDWMVQRGMALISITAEALKCWESILRLPLEPKERFMMLLSLRDAVDGEIKIWEETLQEACSAVEIETEKMKKAIANLRAKTAKSLISSLAKTK